MPILMNRAPAAAARSAVWAVAAFVVLSACVEGAPAVATAAEAAVTRLPEDPGLGWGSCPEIFPAGCEIAVLHGDPAQPNADVFLRTQGGGYRLPAHSHTSAERMILVRGELSVRYRGSELTTLSAGEYAYGPAGAPHEATCVSTEPCVLFIAFEGPVDAVPFDGALE